jgi:hypothetical protein
MELRLLLLGGGCLAALVGCGGGSPGSSPSPTPVPDAQWRDMVAADATHLKNDINGTFAADCSSDPMAQQCSQGWQLTADDAQSFLNDLASSPAPTSEVSVFATLRSALTSLHDAAQLGMKSVADQSQDEARSALTQSDAALQQMAGAAG